MPTSVRRHNLQRLRESLSISQTELAEMIGRTWSTIRSIETGKLALSLRLAAVICAVTGCDQKWLLRNDLSEQMPPLTPRLSRMRKEEEIYGLTLYLLEMLFERLCSVMGRLMSSKQRSEV